MSTSRFSTRPRRLAPLALAAMVLVLSPDPSTTFGGAVFDTRAVAADLGEGAVDSRRGGTDGLSAWDPTPELPFVVGDRIIVRVVSSETGGSYRLTAPNVRNVDPIARSWPLPRLRSRIRVLERGYLSYGPTSALVRAGSNAYHSTTVPPPLA